VDALEAYLVELSANRLAGGVPETSGYGALATLLNEVGHKLKPKVRCVINPANRGAGIPDGGLFVASQFQKGNAEPLPGQLPARGALEVKGVAEDAHTVAERALSDDPAEQLRRYLEKYRQVLVTTYREFVLVGYDADGAPTPLESYSLAATEVGFWLLAASPRKAARLHGERLSEFLKRCLLRQTQIASPQDLAWFLASYAREARARAEERDLPALATTRTALEEALGMSFSGEKGDHFFRSTLVQTLFYGLFAAWVFWGEHHAPTDTKARFDWRSAARYLHIPILQKLFYDFANPAQLGALKLDEVLDWAAEALNRVDRASFFASFEQSHAVQYFYEPFLEAFDPELRKELGVWYTPPEIVQYMVARVDAVLRKELDIADGLADPRVVVLDPCCGTGAYLVEVLNKIAATLREKGDDALTAHDLKHAAMSRIYGFEILPAPFVISHMQIGMFLDRQGAGFADDSNERAGVYLTNALTGWESPTEPKQHLLFTEMEEERDKAEHVKQLAPILVILGNPPYNGHPGVAVEEERDLSTAYRAVKGVAAPQGRGLNDLYVRFFRMAERRITEGAERKGIVCFISNYSWLNGLSFTGMRERYLGAFKRAWIDNLHGDRIISEYAPDGATSETAFAISGKSPGIKIGTAVALLCAAHSGLKEECVVAYRDFTAARAETRRADLLRSLQGGNPYRLVEPAPSIGLPFTPQAVSASYLSWPRLIDLLPVLSPGVMTSRDAFVVDIDKETLEARVRRYFDPLVEDAEVAVTDPGVMRDTGRFHAKETRLGLLRRGFLPEKIVRYSYRPFDARWLYWEPEGKLLDEKRTEYFSNVFPGSLALVAQQKPRRDWSKPQVIGSIGCLDLMDRGASCLPIYLDHVGGQSLFDSADGAGDGPVPNLTEDAWTYAGELGSTPESIAFSAVSVLHAPAYAQENVGALQQDWPRIPLPATREALLASAKLGRTVAALLDVEEPVDAVTTGSVRHELRPVGVLISVSGCQLDPAAGDLAGTVGWGHAGKGGVTMPGRGRAVERPYSDAELAAFREGLTDLGLSYDQLTACLGGACYDVYLNDVAYWRCVPARAWKYTIGGYQVMKKWLSYRERALLGRDLRPDEARYVTEMARRIAAILLLEPALDANYERVKADTYLWPGST